MWGWLYLAILGIAVLMTWLFAVREDAVVFSASLASILWAVLAFVPEVILLTDGAEVSLEIGAVRWIWAALALLSIVTTLAAVVGVYPESTTPESQTFTEVK